MSNNHVAVAGGSGTGKTHRIKHQIIPEVKQYAPVFICDTKGYDYRDVADAKVSHPKQFKQAVEKGHQVIRWIPEFSSSKSDEAGEELDKFTRGCDKAFQDLKYMYMIVDEAHNYQISSHMYADLFERAMREYRGLGANIIQSSQNPTDYATCTWNNSHNVIAHAMESIPIN